MYTNPTCRREKETQKSERVRRHEGTPRPTLPEAVREALQFDEPDIEEAEAPYQSVRSISKKAVLRCFQVYWYSERCVRRCGYWT